MNQARVLLSVHYLNALSDVHFIVRDTLKPLLQAVLQIRNLNAPILIFQRIRKIGKFKIAMLKKHLPVRSKSDKKFIKDCFIIMTSWVQNILQTSHSLLEYLHQYEKRSKKQSEYRTCSRMVLERVFSSSSSFEQSRNTFIVPTRNCFGTAGTVISSELPALLLQSLKNIQWGHT